MSGLVEWIIFLALSAVAVTTAAGMLLTMSMYRAGLALMSCFVALAGLFILLDADLLAAIQVMMNVGGMLVMILFMVMMMMDPGGEMMWDMKRKMRLPGPGAFSMSMPRKNPPAETRQQEHHQHQTAKEQAAEGQTPSKWTCPMHPEITEQQPGQCPICGIALVPNADIEQSHAAEHQAQIYTCPMHPEVRQEQPGMCPKCGMQLIVAEEAPQKDQARHMSADYPSAGQDPPPHADHETHMAGMSPQQHHEMMVDMAMSTAQLPWALAIGAASAILLLILILRTSWPLAGTGPTQDSTTIVGELLLSRYMIAFEGAALLILAGIVGAVIFGTPERHQASQPPAMPAEEPAQKQPDEHLAYTCPMHGDVRETRPGQCPICGMALIPAEATISTPDHKHHGGT